MIAIEFLITDVRPTVFNTGCSMIVQVACITRAFFVVKLVVFYSLDRSSKTFKLTIFK